MLKRWKRLCGAAAITVLAGGLTGCSTFKAVVRDGQPDMSDQNLMIPMPGNEDPPDQCRGYRDDHTATDPAFIRRCTTALKLMIDRRFTSYKHELYSLVTTGNALSDATISGLGVAGTLTAPGTTKILSAIIAGLNGLKTTVNDDVLYKNSILLIIGQMEKDRASVATVIQKNLNAGDGGYKSIEEAANDLYAYFVAGTFDDAILRMQSDAGAQQAACEAELKNAKLKEGTGTATATAPCSTTVVSAATTLPNAVTVPFIIAKTDLGPAAKALVDAAATTFKAAESSGAAASLVVVGGATFPASASNQALAVARAQAVQAELVAQGIDAAKITTSGVVNNTLSAAISFSTKTPGS